MEIRGKAWRPGDLKSFCKVQCISPAAYDDQAKAIEYATDRVRAELIAHSGTEKDPELYYNIPSYEYKSLIKDVREKALKEGRKEVWDMARRLYLTGEVENAYGYAELQKEFGTFSYSEILQKDVHEVLAKDNERLKRIEEEKTIRLGDEVEVDTDSPWHSDVCHGWVVNVHGETVSILISTRYGIEMRYVGLGICRKTGNTAEHLAQLIKAMKEER